MIRWILLILTLSIPCGVTAVVITKSSTATGNVSVLGTLSKGSGTFVIDHPLDPKNKLLFHSFVESPDVKNIYDGVAVLDSSGEVIIELPPYFIALNREFRYQVTALGTSMPNLYLKSEVHREWLFGNPIFSIAGGVAGGEVSWQVTGNRHDAFILEHPIVTEVEKGPDTIVNKGACIFEPLCE